MRASCNGCRVLRKGCKDGCELRASLQWIRTSHAQANATVFLAKFYGRAGLINLINSGPPQQRSTIFKSLLYEACGRTVDPVFGSLGLLCSGNWHLCHAAVQAVLEGYTFPSIISPSPPQGMIGEDFGKAKVSKVGNKNSRFKHSRNKARKERSSQIECIDNDTMKGNHVSDDELVDNHGSCGENMGLELELSLSSCVTILNNHGLTFNGLHERRVA